MGERGSFGTDKGVSPSLGNSRAIETNFFLSNISERDKGELIKGGKGHKHSAFL